MPAPVTIITGAGSGIGRETAVKLAALGHRLALVGRSREKLDQTIELIGQQGGSTGDLLPVVADLADPDQARSVVDRTAGHYGSVDVLINNAGAVEVVPLASVDQAALDRMFAVNVFGPAHLIAAVWPSFVKQSRGCIVNVSTMSTVDPFPGLGAYAAAKAGLESLTRSIMNERGESDIRAFTIVPGAVETPMLRSIASRDDLPPEMTLDPADVAEVIVQCVRGERDGELGKPIHLPSP